MTILLDRIRHNFSESIQTKINAADAILPDIGMAAEKIVQCLLDGHKILSCGNGGSACDASHFTSQMLNCFKHERPSLPAIALNSDIPTITSIANKINYNEVFAKQIRALGQPGDVLLALSTTGESASILAAIKAAHDRQMNVVVLTGHDGGKIPAVLQADDVEVRVPANDSTRVQETHILIIHCICDVVDYQLFGHGEVVT